MRRRNDLDVGTTLNQAATKSERLTPGLGSSNNGSSKPASVHTPSANFDVMLLALWQHPTAPHHSRRASGPDRAGSFTTSLRVSVAVASLRSANASGRRHMRSANFARSSSQVLAFSALRPGGSPGAAVSGDPSSPTTAGLGVSAPRGRRSLRLPRRNLGEPGHHRLESAPQGRSQPWKRGGLPILDPAQRYHHPKTGCASGSGHDIGNARQSPVGQATPADPTPHRSNRLSVPPSRRRL